MAATQPSHNFAKIFMKPRSECHTCVIITCFWTLTSPKYKLKIIFLTIKIILFYHINCLQYYYLIGDLASMFQLTNPLVTRLRLVAAGAVVAVLLSCQNLQNQWPHLLLHIMHFIFHFILRRICLFVACLNRFLALFVLKSYFYFCISMYLHTHTCQKMIGILFWDLSWRTVIFFLNSRPSTSNLQKFFSMARTIYSTSESSEQFLKQNNFSSCYWSYWQVFEPN
jgi:hypothetical protein